MSKEDKQLPFSWHVVSTLQHFYFIEDFVSCMFVRTQKVVIRNPESKVVVGALDVVKAVCFPIRSFIGAVQPFHDLFKRPVFLWRNILITVTAFAAIIMFIFLVDTMQWEGFIMVRLPVIMLGTGIYLIGLSVYRAKQKLTYATMLLLGILALLFPILLFLLLCFAFIIGGPVPT